jgi:hypothetical protein
MASDQLDALLADMQKAKPEATPVAAPPPAKTADTTPETPPPAAPPEPDPAPAPVEPAVEPDPTAPEKLGKFRLTATSYRDAEVMRLIAKSQAENRADPSKPVLSLKDAVAAVYGEPKAEPKKDAAPDTPPANPTAGIDAQIEAAKGEIAKLEADLAKAADEVDGKKIASLTLEISRRERRIENMEGEKARMAKEAEHQAASAQEQIFRQKVSDAAKQSKKDYPAIADATSETGQEFRSFLDQKMTDPDYEGVFASPRWPVILAREFAEAKGLKPTAAGTPPAAPPPAAPKPSAPTPQPRATAATVVTPAATGAPTFAPTAEGLKKLLPDAPVKFLDELLASTG